MKNSSEGTPAGEGHKGLPPTHPLHSQRTRRISNGECVNICGLLEKRAATTRGGREEKRVITPYLEKGRRQKSSLFKPLGKKRAATRGKGK